MSRKGEIGSSIKRGLTALELTMNFFDDRTALGLGAAVERLRIGLKTANIWREEEDERLLGALLAQELSDQQIHDALNATARTGIPNE